MTVLNLSLLAGTAFIAVPILLHLVMRRQPKHLVFPALRFVQQKQEANRRRMRLRHWLLLLLRCATLALLALALARPSVRPHSGGSGKDGPIAAVLVLDNSPRMQYRQDNSTRLQAAQQLADWLLERLGEQTEVGIMDLSGGPTSFAPDVGAARGRLARVDYVTAPRRLADAIVDAVTLAQTKNDHRKEIYVFTDFSAAQWTDAALNQIKEEFDRDEDVTLYVVDVGVPDAKNVALGELKISHDLIGRDDVVQLESTVTGPATDEIKIELYLAGRDGKQEKRGQHPFSEGGDTIQFQLSGLPYGTHQGVVQVIEPDGLMLDNARYFTIDVRPPRKVLLLVEDPRDAVFLREAISPDMAGRQSGRLECAVVSFDEATGQTLSSYAAVCLLDPPPLADRLWDGLQTYVREGGGLAVFLGHRVKFVAPFNASLPQALLPGPLLRQSREETYLRPTDYAHPALARLQRYARAGSIPWQDFPVYIYWELSQIAGDVDIVARYANGKPAILERSVGKGRAVTMTTPVSDRAYLRNRDPWNRLPTGGLGAEPWPFLVMAEDLVSYLAGTAEDRRNYRAGETALLKLSQEERVEALENHGYVVFPPAGDGVAQSFHIGDDAVVFAGTRRLGNYRVEAGGRTGALKRGFSVNVDDVFSRLERTTPEAITNVLGEDRVQFAKSADDIEIRVGLSRHGRELFAWLIFAVAMILAAEHVLANRFYRETS